jgi:peptidoglycan-associated lipoprotein
MKMEAKNMSGTSTRLWIVFSFAVLAGCAGQTPSEQPPVGVEERKPGAPGGAPQKPAAQTRPVQTAPVGAIDLTKKPVSESNNPLKDPKSILSRRAIFFDYDRFDVRDEFKSLLEAHAKYLRENAGSRM